MGLTAKQIQGLNKPGRYLDSQGLYLVVRKDLGKQWIQRVRVDGNRTDKGVGKFPEISVVAARKIANANRAALENGRNPWEKKQRPLVVTLKPKTVPTFAEAALKVYEDNRPAWRNGKHSVSWIQCLERYAFPAFGDARIDEVTSRDVLDILLPIWHTKAETADRLRGRIRKVFDWAVSADYVDVNPAGEKIKGALPKHKRLKAHFKALPYAEVPAAYQTINWSDAQRETVLAFQFLILTAARTIEVRSATWDEMDLENGVWTIPGEKMKNGQTHRQPLSYQALLLLQGAKLRPPKNNPSNLVFPRPDGGMQSENTFINRCKKDGLDTTAHGFRSSFRDWAEEQTEVPASHAAVELSLAHNVGNEVERAYRRTDLLDQRRPLLEAWSDFAAGYDRPPF